MTTLEVHGVSISRAGRTVVRDITLTVAAGEITVLLGANGAGKSTLVQAIAGLLPLEAGSVRVDGRAIAGLPPHRVRAAGVAAVPEGHRVFAGLTVAESLRVAASRLSARELRGGVEHALALFPELTEHRDQEASNLSGGQQQMLAIASALVARPRFLIIDELSLGLAPVIVRRLVPTVREIAAEGVGVLLVEQFAHVALEVGSRAVVLDRGRVVFDGTPSTLADEPGLLYGAYLTR